MFKKLTIFIIASIAILTVAIFYRAQNNKEISAAATRSGLVGWWSMDTQDMSATGATLYDKSGQNNHGTVTGTTTSTGKIGQAKDFPGLDAQHIYFVNSGWTGATTITLSAWTKTDTLSIPGGHRMILTLGDQGYMSFVTTDVGSPFCSMLIGGTQRTVSSGITAKVGQWYFTTCVYDGDSLDIYVDGVLINQNTLASGAITGFNATKYIGRYRVNGYGWDGQIDDVRIYDRNLSAEEIATLYNSAKVGYQTAPSRSSGATASGKLVGWWTMDTQDMSPTGATLYDKSGQNNHGTVIGTTTSTGRINQARNFNSTGSIAITTGSSLNFGTGAFTLATWIKPTVIDLNLPRISSRTADAFDFSYYNGQLAFYDGGWHTNTGVYVPINQWSHVAITRSGSSYVLYSNGVGTTVAGNNPSVTGNLFIGSYIGAVAFWTGQIDDFRIYNYALSAQEVSNLYTSAKASYSSGPSRTGLVGYWTMDAGDNAGGKMLDRSGLGNHGAMIGTTTSTGKIGQSRTFNGTSDWMSEASVVGMPLGQNRTYCMWFYLPTIPATQKPLLDFNAGNSRIEISYATVGDISVQGYDGASKRITVSNLTSANIWQHICGVYDNSNINLYFNGVYKNQTAYTGSNLYASTVLGVSAYSNGTGFLAAKIDDVRMYNYALTAQQVANLYQSSRKVYMK